jgi:hypothetical protein
MAWNVWNLSEERWENLTSYPTKGAAKSFLKDVVERDANYGIGPWEVRVVGDVMEQHGTKLMQLKPSMIWRCAMDDLDRKAYNKDPVPGQYKQYAFHRRHVIKASTANDILRAAIAEPGLGQASGKRDTRLLYADVELLKAALQ